MKRSLAIAGVIGTVGLASIGGVSAASAKTAQDSTSLTKPDRTASLQKAVDSGAITAAQKATIEAKLAELKAARTARQEAQKQWASTNGVDATYLSGRYTSEKLQAAVDAGDITAEQKTLIETKRKELEAERASRKTALEAWAKENGIDAKYVTYERGGKKPTRSS